MACWPTGDHLPELVVCQTTANGHLDPSCGFLYIPVICWEHSTTVCGLIAGRARLRLAHPPTPTPLLPAHPPTPTPLPPAHPLITAIHNITVVIKNYHKNQQWILHGRVSYVWNSSYKSDLLIQQILRGYNVAQEEHSCFNVSKWHFSKYKIWHYGRFSQTQLHKTICTTGIWLCYPSLTFFWLVVSLAASIGHLQIATDLLGTLDFLPWSHNQPQVFVCHWICENWP